MAVADFTCAGGSFFYSPRLKFKFKIVVDVTSDVLPLFFVTSFLLNFLNILLWVSRRDTQGHMNLRKHNKKLVISFSSPTSADGESLKLLHSK
jgi:hypothetical protein